MKKTLLLLMLMIGLLAGCTEYSGKTIDTPSPTSTRYLDTKTVSPTPPQSNTSTAMANPTASSTPTPLPTTSATGTPDYNIQAQCLEIESELPAEIILEGQLVLASPINQDEQLDPQFLLNLETWEKVPFPKNGEKLHSFKISPDRNWLASTNSSEDQVWIVITNAQGQIISSIPKFIKLVDLQEPIDSQIGSLMDYSWLDDQHLIIRVINLEYDEMLILNPFTGERKQLFADYPNSSYWGMNYSWKIFYVHDSTFTRVVYPGYSDEFDSSMVLYDVQNQELLANKEAYKTFEEPKWSPDDTLVAMTFSEFPDLKPIKKELYIMERDGQLHQLTFFTDIFEDASVENFSWSPDSSKIAFTFWDSPKENFSTSIAIVDVVSQEITNYCLSGVANPPIWSPNGKQLAISTDSIRDGNTKVIIIDIENGTAFQIAENLHPVGWMVSPNE